MDNGSSHRGDRCVQHLQGQHPNLVPVHGPVHASWLNQIEIFFSILQRNAKRSRPTTSRPLRLSPSASRRLSATMNRSPNPSSGNSHVAIWQRCSPRSNRLTSIRRRHESNGYVTILTKWSTKVYVDDGPQCQAHEARGFMLIFPYISSTRVPPRPPGHRPRRTQTTSSLPAAVAPSPPACLTR
ncbi:MAG: transposase [Gammaproteobacteria bacterium]